MIKPVDEFSFKSIKRGKRRSECKECCREMRRDYYLRNTKKVKIHVRDYKRTRKENPQVFLAILYGRMVERTKLKGYQSICSRGYFYNFSLTNSNFLALYANWKEVGFKQAEIPSVDRIDFRKGYEEGNMQFLTMKQNALKGFYENL